MSWQILIFSFPVCIGSNEATTRYEEKKAGSIRKTNRMPEGKIRSSLFPCWY